MTNDLQRYYPLYQSKVIGKKIWKVISFQKKLRLEWSKDDPSEKSFSQCNSIFLPLSKTFKASSQQKKWEKKKSELFSLFWNTLTSHQQIIIFLRTSTSLCNGEYHMWAAYTSTAWCNTSPRKLFSCFEEPHNWETHKTQTTLCTSILNWQARTECLRIKTSLKKNLKKISLNFINNDNAAWQAETILHKGFAQSEKKLLYF